MANKVGRAYLEHALSDEDVKRLKGIALKFDMTLKGLVTLLLSGYLCGGLTIRDEQVLHEVQARMEAAGIQVARERARRESPRLRAKNRPSVRQNFGAFFERFDLTPFVRFCNEQKSA
jgi:hypothetical protein